jgi:aminoglycoside phosphotransferase (APT) family kinase protein
MVEQADSDLFVLIPELRRWIVEQSGGQLVCVKRLPGGNRREAWAVDVSIDGRMKELFLRYDPIDPSVSGDVFTISREATFYRALKDSGVSIPAIINLHPQLQAMLTERVRGSSSFVRISSLDEKTRVSLDFMRHLARLHGLRSDYLKAHFSAASKPVSSLIAEEIETWNKLYQQTEIRDPLIEFGLSWLSRNIPLVEEPSCVVHGDAGPGNFLFDAGAVTALLDWELAHLGDPLEDLAWLSMRTVLEPFPDFAACLREYQKAAGRNVDYDRIRYHRVLVQWRIVIIRHRSAGEDVANSLISRALNRRLLVDAIAASTGVTLPAYVPVSAPPNPKDIFYNAALTYLRDVISPAILDPFAVAKTKSVARIIKYLQKSATLDRVISQAERDDLAEILGYALPSLESGQAELAERIRAREIDESLLLRYFAQDVGRGTQLMESVLGALAWRPFPSMQETSQ